MKNKLVSLLLIAVMTTAVLSGCGSKADESGTGKKDDKKEAQSITFMAPDWAIPTDEQLDAFTEETGIEVVVNEVGWDDIREKMVTDLPEDRKSSTAVDHCRFLQFLWYRRKIIRHQPCDHRKVGTYIDKAQPEYII